MNRPGLTPPNDPKTRDPAKMRFLAITLLRWSGVGLVLLGLLINAEKIPLPKLAGVALVFAGLFDIFVMPRILVRKWKSPDQ